VINRLSQLVRSERCEPGISPASRLAKYSAIVGGTARLFGGRSQNDRGLDCWKRRFKAVPGVVDVNGWGGKTKTFEVRIEQAKLLHYGVTAAAGADGAQQR